MKKYVFIFGLLVLLACLAAMAWAFAALSLLLLLAWIAYETHLRTRFRFLEGRGARESAFDLGADPAQAEIAADGSCALFLTLDHNLSLRTAGGREQWARPMEPHTLAVLPLPGGRAYFAVEDEVILTDARGAAQARLSFAPPPFRQSYQLLLSADGSTLLLHTPWFLQFMAPDLSALGPRIPCEETGHYMKYCSLAPDASLVAFAGAKLLEEGEGTEARWGAWKREAGAWKPAWAQAVETYGNSHLRGIAFSRDGSRICVEIFHGGYHFRVLDRGGATLWSPAGEHPALSPDGRLVLWESPVEGLTLSQVGDGAKLWSRKLQEKLRYLAVNAKGESLALEGRSLRRIDAQGVEAWSVFFRTDPYRFSAAPLAPGRLALIWKAKGAMLELPF